MVPVTRIVKIERDHMFSSFARFGLGFVMHVKGCHGVPWKKETHNVFGREDEQHSFQALPSPTQIQEQPAAVRTRADPIHHMV